MTSSRVHVVVGVLRQNDQVLVAWREHDRHVGDCWEFPGGKVEAGEEPAQAMSREWREEIGVEIETGLPLICVQYDYPDRCIMLDVREVKLGRGDIVACEGQGLRWYPIEEFDPTVFPPANRSVLTAIKLPSRYAILPDYSGDALDKTVRHILDSGNKLILMRSHQLKHDYAEADRIAGMAREYGADIMLHDRADWVEPLGVAGVHFSQAQMRGIKSRPVPEQFYFAVSCHSLEEIQQAESLDADFCCLSAVAPTPNHDKQPLGMDAFRDIARLAKIPVFALGGMTAADIPCVRENGGQGIAGIRCFLFE